ncbi:rubredoxin-NAD(+) reductase [Rhizodiscina lignyota]|uniref:Rubredoxin-NAD(+) reductase n=1 Tax=Rhizodiscina lignyota TaxID=1504668 RepID=A0A9P4IRM6_9PEZI|nr:rubredoxin-NAD(+) reductase [Rhizodiscina lignyota]
MAQEFKLKGISSIDLKNGQKEEYEVEGLQDVKVLLAKVNNEVHALSPKCTHYGAPLVKGVITGSGRLTCPWHGACFKISTGEIEDAPALDPLAKFEIVEKNGAVYIKGEESVVKAARRGLSLKCAAKGTDKVLIVGGGSGTVGLIEALRENGFSGPVTVISREGYLPIDRTKLSKALLADAKAAAWRNDAFYQDASVEFVTDEVKSVDFSGKKVSSASGKTYDYSKLVLATGGTPRWLPLSGLKGDLGNVFVLRTIPDVQQILQAVGDNGKKIVVIGSSFIGMEVGNALAQKGNTVSIVGMEKVPMERVMGEEIGKIFQGLVEKTGVKFYMQASVDKATPSKSDSSKVGAVLLKDGTEIEADLVIEGVGVGPATEYLRGNSAVELNRDGSLTTDESFAVKGLKDVYAIGDIATYPYHGPGGNGHPVRIEHWNVAQNAGRSVALTIAKPSSKPKPFIPVFWSAMGAQLRYCGNTMAGGYDDLIVKGETDPQKSVSWVAYYCKGEEVVAVASMMKDPYMTQCAELMRRAAMPSKSELKKGVDPMEISVPAEVKM